MRIEIPKLSLVILIGVSGSGKSTFAKKHFDRTEIISYDRYDGTNPFIDQSALLGEVERRLTQGKLAVIDAAHVKKEDRKQLIALAEKHHVMVVGILFDLPEEVCLKQSQWCQQEDGRDVIKRQKQQLQRDRNDIENEGFHYFYTFTSPKETSQVTIKRVPLKVDLREEKGPFDIIGDIHGCFFELRCLLEKLGYQIEQQSINEEISFQVKHPEGRKVVFLGDLVDRGPNSPLVLQLVMDMVASGNARCVMGNHDKRLLSKLEGRNVDLRHGLEQTLEQMKDWSAEWIEKVKRFLQQLAHHYVLDAGRLVVAHAGLIEPYHGRHSKAVRSFAIFGDQTGKRDQYGFPIRRNWAKHYRGEAMVVYGHTPVDQPVFQNRTVNIDTGCVFGGRLTAFRYPEYQCCSVLSKKRYADLGRPFFTIDEFK